MPGVELLDGLVQESSDQFNVMTLIVYVHTLSLAATCSPHMPAEDFVCAIRLYRGTNSMFCSPVAVLKPVHQGWLLLGLQ